MAQAPTFTNVEKALIIASIKLQVKSTERAARSYSENGKPATAKTLQDEVHELNNLIQKIRALGE